MSKAEIENLILKSFDAPLDKKEALEFNKILESTYWRDYYHSIQKIRGLARNQSPTFSSEFSNKLFDKLEARSAPKTHSLPSIHAKNHSAGYSCTLVDDFFNEFTQKTHQKYNHWLYYFGIISKYAVAALFMLILFNFMLTEEQSLKSLLGHNEMVFDHHLAYVLFIQN